LPEILTELAGRPVDTRGKDEMFGDAIGERTPEQAVEFILENLQHHTHKAGALLGAQGIFVVVATYALDHGVPRALALSAMLLLLVASLILMTVLKSSSSALRGDRDSQAQRIFAVLMGRVLRFNIALYMTFAAVALLALGTAWLVM
jgi:hypothetical protein